MGLPPIVSSLEDTIAKLRGQLGVSWPNPWWPTGAPADNDCAAFQSWGLWGLNGDQPYQTVVSGVIERSGLEFHAGNQGIRRGDLLGLRWSAQVNYDHIGMALGSPNADGVVQTIDANGATNKVAISARSILNVHNFARPNYPTVSTAEVGSALIDNRRKAPMYTHFINDPAIAARKVPVVYCAFTDANGQPRLRVAGVNEAAIAYAGGLSIPADSGTINGLGTEMGYQSSEPHATLVPTVSGAGGPVTVNAQVDVQPELVAALKDPTVLAALSAAIKIPTKIEATLS